MYLRKVQRVFFPAVWSQRRRQRTRLDCEGVSKTRKSVNARFWKSGNVASRAQSFRKYSKRTVFTFITCDQVVVEPIVQNLKWTRTTKEGCRLWSAARRRSLRRFHFSVFTAESDSRFVYFVYIQHAHRGEIKMEACTRTLCVRKPWQKRIINL